MTRNQRRSIMINNLADLIEDNYIERQRYKEELQDLDDEKLAEIYDEEFPNNDHE